MQQTETEQEPKFWLKYIQIPTEVLMNENLTPAEMKTFGLIDALDGIDHCYASNEYMATILNLSVTSISIAVKKLKQEGYIKQLGFDGRVRVIAVDQDYKQRYSESLSILKGRIDMYLKEKNIKYKLNEKTKKELSSKEDKSKPAVCNSSSERSPLDVSPRKIPEKEFLEEASPVKASNNRPARSDDILPRQRAIKGQLPYENASPEARKVVDAWNKLETTPVHKNTSKAIQGVCRLLDDKLLKKYDVEDILRTMRDFSDMQKDARTYKVSAKKLNIADFFSNNGYVTDMMHRQERHMEPPWFDRLILPGSFMKYLRKRDPNPELAKEFKRLYERNVSGEVPEFYTPTQERHFAKASEQLKKCMDRGRLGRCVDGAGATDYIIHFLKALDAEWGISNVRVWHLGAVDSWNDVFPRYMTRNWKEID